MKKSSVYITEKSIRFTQLALDSENRPVVKEEIIDVASLEKEKIGLSLKAYLKENKIIPEYLVLGIPRSQVSIKYLSLPTHKEAEIRQMVEYELNNLFPFSLKELTVDYALIQKQAEGFAQVMLVAAEKNLILDKVSVLQQAGLIPDEITISTTSLFNQFCGQERQPGSYLLIHFDGSSMEMLLINDSKLTFSRGVRLDSEDDKRNTIKTLDSTITVLRDKNIAVDCIVVSGRGEDAQDFAHALERSLPYKVEIDTALSTTTGLTAQNNHHAWKINLLPEELRIQKKQHIRKRALLYLGVLFFLNVSLIVNIIFVKMRAKEGYLYLLKSEIAKVDPHASGLQKKILNLQLLQGHLRTGRVTLALLSEVYRLAPEGVFINSLDISNKAPQGIMTVVGQTQDSDTVLKFANALKGARHVKKADVSYIKKIQEASRQVVDFEIRAYFTDND